MFEERDRVKAQIACRAPEAPHLRVRNLVSFKVADLNEALSTAIADERFLHGMDALVDFKVAFAVETFVAHWAGEGLLPRVSPFMRPERGQVGEALAAPRTGEWSLPAVSQQVFFQAFRVCEILAAF